MKAAIFIAEENGTSHKMSFSQKDFESKTLMMDYREENKLDGKTYEYTEEYPTTTSKLTFESIREAHSVF